MNIKAKKMNDDGIVRVETSGILKEVIINGDLLRPKEASVLLCFKGKKSSGIVELSLDEIRTLTKEIEPKISIFGNTQVMKFEKE